MLLEKFWVGCFPCLLPEMYVFILVRKRGVICAVTPILLIPIQGVYKTVSNRRFLQFSHLMRPLSLVEICTAVLEKLIFKSSLFRNYLPFGKGCGLSFEHIWILFTQGCFVSSLVEIGSREEDENVKSLRQQRQRQRTKLTWAFG